MHLIREYKTSYYEYSPSLGAAIVFAVLYSITLILSVFQWIRYRAWVWIVMVTAVASKLYLHIGNYHH
jgi:hypothetical protein